MVVAEFFAANKGLGFYINFSGTTLRTDRVMLGVIILGLLGRDLGEGVRRIERRYREVAAGDQLSSARRSGRGPDGSASALATTIRGRSRASALLDVAPDQDRDAPVVPGQVGHGPIGIADPDRLEELLVDRARVLDRRPSAARGRPPGGAAGSARRGAAGR